MNRRPRLLDLFSGAGGAAMGYHRAGFEVVGVDIKPQPHYPFEFHQADALEYVAALAEGIICPGCRSICAGDHNSFWCDACGQLWPKGHDWGAKFDAIHASPPCQAYTPMSNRWRASGRATREWPRLIEPIRSLLEPLGVPWVMENVQGAPLRADVKLCGYPFGLRVHRHRLFETSGLIFGMTLQCRGWKDHVGVYGDHPDGGRLWTRKDGHAPLRRAASIEEGRAAMGIDWMDWPELKEAIPPAYTEWIGVQLRQAIENERQASDSLLGTGL